MLLVMDQGIHITSNQRIFIEQVNQIKMGINVICKVFELDEVIFIVQKQNRNTVLSDVLNEFGIRYLKLDITQSINTLYLLQAVKNLSMKNSISTKQISVWEAQTLQTERISMRYDKPKKQSLQCLCMCMSIVVYL